MKRILALLLLLPAIALGQDLQAKYLSAINEGGAGIARGMVLHAPFDDPANPLKAYVGSASTFTRAHDATHTATFVHPTTGLVTAASADQLRIEATGALVEAASANLFARSAQFDNTTIWTQNASRVVVDNAIAPDGTLSAEKFVADGTNDYHRITYSVTVVDQDSMTVSVYAKKSGDESRYLIILQYDNAGHVSRFDLQLGTVTACATGFTCGIASAPNGFYRAWSRSVNNAGTTLAGAIMLASADSYAPYGGDNATGGWLWGAQMEKGALSSYIPTVATAMTRNTDALTLPTIASPGTAIATVDGVKQKITYATFDPVGHHMKQLRVWSRTLSASEVSILAP